LLQSLELAVELFRIYLIDESEEANIAAIDAITAAFSAVAGALFYVNAENQYRFSLAGSQFPIGLTEDRWRECINDHTKSDQIKQFDDWAIPGIEHPVRYWASSPLYASGSGNGYVFLGKDSGGWTDDEIAGFHSVTDVISEIVAIRYKRELESRTRREAEERLEAIALRMQTFFESSRDMIYTMDGDYRFTSVNSAGLRLLGVEDERLVLGHTFGELVENKDAHEFFAQKIARDGYVADLEVVLRRVDGVIRFCLETSHAIKNESGAIIEIQGHIKDITERIRNEREIWQMNLELADVNLRLTQTQNLMVQHEKLASIGQLAAGIAHEINNPLGFLKSNQAMLVSYFKTIQSVHEQVRALNIPEREAIARAADLEYLFDEADHIFAENDEGFARIVQIISNLMTFARMEKNGDFEDYDVNEGIERTLVVAANEIKYVADVIKELDGVPHVPAHGGEINQVILNILVNAAQAIAGQKRTERGRIAIKTFLEGGYVGILISDDGPGIPQEIMTRIFDPFFTTKDPGKGTGLGLNISYDIIVNKHKGRLSAESEPGKGATFRIDLPITRPGA